MDDRVQSRNPKVASSNLARHQENCRSEPVRKHGSLFFRSISAVTMMSVEVSPVSFGDGESTDVQRAKDFGARYSGPQ